MINFETKGVPWGSGIGKDVTDCKTVKEVMEKAHLDFTVKKCELVARMPFTINGNNIVNELMGDFVHDGEIFRGCYNAFATYRTDLAIPLGVVKSKYEVVQNIEAFDFFDEAIGEGKAIWQNAGMFGQGHKVFVTAKLPITTGPNNDPIDNYLVFSNSHDGSSSINILFTPIRVACTNMLNGALEASQSYIRLKHTKTVKDRLHRGAEILRIACEYAKDASQLYTALETIKMSDEEVMQYIANLNLTDKELEELRDYDPKLGYKKLFVKDYGFLEKTNISVKKANKIINMFEYYQDGIAQKPILGTAWGAYNAITGYYSNVANLEGEKRMDFLLYGGGITQTSKALNAAINFKAA